LPAEEASKHAQLMLKYLNKHGAVLAERRDRAAVGAILEAHVDILPRVGFEYPYEAALTLVRPFESTVAINLLLGLAPGQVTVSKTAAALDSLPGMQRSSLLRGFHAANLTTRLISTPVASGSLDEFGDHRGLSRVATLLEMLPHIVCKMGQFDGAVGQALPKQCPMAAALATSARIRVALMDDFPGCMGAPLAADTCERMFGWQYPSFQQPASLLSGKDCRWLASTLFRLGSSIQDPEYRAAVEQLLSLSMTAVVSRMVAGNGEDEVRF
jgi:hypothetical protein